MSSLHCPVCREPTEPDAAICGVCGAVLSGSVTGTTEPLDPALVEHCPQCTTLMEAGQFVAPPQGGTVFWAATPPDADDVSDWQDWSGREVQVLPIVALRCPQCGLVVSRARGTP